MLLFCIQNKIDFTNDSINQSLVLISKIGSIDLVKYLIEHCNADVETNFWIYAEKKWITSFFNLVKNNYIFLFLLFD